MIITSIRSVKTNEKTYNLKSFIKDTDIFENCICGDGKIEPNKRNVKKSLSVNGLIPLKLYNVDGKLYVYFNDKRLYKIVDNALIRVSETEFKNTPIILKAPVYYDDSIIIIDGDSAFITGKTDGNVYFPKAKGFFVLEDYVFAYNGKSLFFGCRTDDDFLLKDNYFGRIDVGDGLGEIIGITAVKNVLAVFSNYGISTLSMLDNKKDYKLKESVALPLSIREKTIKRIGDSVYFIAGKKLCKYSLSGITFLDCFLEGKDFEIVDEAYCYNDKYCLTVSIQGRRYVYVYSAIDGLEKIIVSDNLLLADGGYCFDKTDNKIYSIEDGTGDLFYWKSKELCFNDNQAKIMSSVTVCGKGEFNLLISGEFGDREYNVSANKKLNGLALFSKSFIFEIDSKTASSLIDGIKIEYRE